MTGRIGTIVGRDGRTLIYAKGGLAWGEGVADMDANNALAGVVGPPNAASRSRFSELGWTVGGGVEYALTERWSARAEYDYINLASHDMATPNATPIADPTFPGIEGAISPDGRRASVNQDIHAFKIGVNYHFGKGSGSEPSLFSAVLPAAETTNAPRVYEIQAGARYVHWWSRFQQDLVLPANISRLTWDDVGMDGGEAFWRIDAPRGLMIKGFWGAGSGEEGHINDEDWGLFLGTHVQPYQNTISGAESSARYVTADLGYTWLAGATYKLTPFVGYNYFRQNMDAHGITIENFSPPHSVEPYSVVPLQQFTETHSLRVGSAAELMLASRLKLSADVAYLPHVRFEGTDVHPLRTDVPSIYSPQWGDGKGMQVELALAYDVTQQISIGVGGRYWAMWVEDGVTDNFSSGDIVSQRFAAEQAAVFAQASYKFDIPCCARSPLK